MPPSFEKQVLLNVLNTTRGSSAFLALMEAQLRSAILRNMQLDLNMWDSPSHLARCEADGGATLRQAGTDTPSPPEPSAAAEMPKIEPEPPAAAAAEVPKEAFEPSAGWEMKPENVSETFVESDVEVEEPPPQKKLPPPKTMKRPAAAVKAAPKEPAAKKNLKRPAAAEEHPADAELEQDELGRAMKRPAVKSEKDEGLGASLKRPAAVEIEKDEGEQSSPAAPDAEADSSWKRPKAERSYTSEDGAWEAGGKNKIVLFFLIAASARGYTRLAST